MSVKRVAKFVEQLAETDAGEIVLFHMSAAQRRSQVGKWSDWNNASDITAIIWENAVAFASGLSGMQTFLVMAFAKGDLGRTDPISSTSFRAASEAAPGEETGSEPPSEVGLVAMAMRMADMLFKNFNMMVGATTYHLSDTVKRQSDQIETLIAQRTMDADTREELLSKKHDRDVEMKRIEGKAKRDEEIFGRVMAYLPVAINHLAGKELVHQKDTELELVAVELARQFSMPQLDKMRDSGLFTPQQLILMATMLEKVVTRVNTMEKVAKESAAANNLASSPQEPKPTQASP
jgi:hypothetical protein